MNRKEMQKVVQALEPEPYWAERYIDREVIPQAVKILKQALAESERKPLTDKEIRAVYRDYLKNGDGDCLRFARAIEMAHGIGEQHE